MANWLLKTEPSTYSFADLVRDKKTTWDGISNNTALIHLRAMKPGDAVLMYHTGDERQVVGLAEVTSKPYADPKQSDPKLVVVDLKPKRKLGKSVTLAQIKANPKLAGIDLVRISRLSVMPVSDAHWSEIMKLAGE